MTPELKGLCAPLKNTDAPHISQSQCAPASQEKVCSVTSERALPSPGRYRTDPLSNNTILKQCTLYRVLTVFSIASHCPGLCLGPVLSGFQGSLSFSLYFLLSLLSPWSLFSFTRSLSLFLSLSFSRSLSHHALSRFPNLSRGSAPSSPNHFLHRRFLRGQRSQVTKFKSRDLTGVVSSSADQMINSVALKRKL